ncbi:MarR family winged helix-turn-helix transcriptional regulator [Brevibacterium senegalense]|uniref:MarR family winged helix-turn-helix transcriptional regulator n=1 Tax=Brevibacterium senegalense TaxID=1033736 RepID=UPI00030BED03|nr:MarR family transcriptional regulator [Brevibacterium senegalense]
MADGAILDDGVLDDLERSLATVLRLLADRATASDVAQRCGYDLPPASWALLEYVDTYGALRVSDIAACHRVDVSSITPRLKRIENAGLVRRERVPSDARAYLISITAEGARALRSVHAARREILRHALDGIDQEQLSDAARVLHRIAEHLSPEPLRPVSR